MARLRVGTLQIAYETDGVAGGDPVLLFLLMGLGGARQAWDLVRPVLARDHRLILIDNRDAGESDEATSGYGIVDMARDALGVLDHLGIGRSHVVGASMGGAIAQRVAAEAPARVASLVLVSTWGRTDAFLGAVFSGWRLLVERLAPDEFLRVQAPWAFTTRFLAAPPPEVVAAQARFRERGVLTSVAAYQRQVDACLGHDALAVLPRVEVPALVVVGDDDILTPPRYARALVEALPRAEEARLPATGHACFLESAGPCAEALLGFLGRQRSRG